MKRMKRNRLATRLISCIVSVALVVGCCVPSLAFAQTGAGHVSSAGQAGSLAAGSSLSAQAASDTFNLADNPIVISTRADLEAFRNAVNDYENLGLADKTVKLARDIDLGGSAANPWTPIGFVNVFKSGRAYSAWGFGGTFDGQGHTISGLYINSDEGGQALFGFLLTGATLKNLVVKGTVTSKGSCVAGVVASAALEASPDTVIRNVGNEVNVTSTATGDNVYVGGVLAYAEYQSAVISGCYNKGALEANRSVSYVGGISGWRGTVSDCYNVGDITVNNSNSSTCAGGIIGSYDKSNGSVARCYSNASITLTGSSSVYCGGIAGSGSTMQDCYFNGQLASQGVGGYVAADGASAYEDAASLLQALRSASGATTWVDGSTVNVMAGGTPALSWESQDVAAYSITKAPSQHGTFSTSYDKCVAGATVTVTPAPDAGYVAGDIKVTDAGGAAVDVVNGSFVMPARNVVVSMTFQAAPKVYYSITKAASQNGSFTVSCESALVNTRVSVAPAPADDYEVAGISVTTSSGVSVPVNDGVFVMPAANVVVSVTFRACVYLDARVVVKPMDGQSVPQDLTCLLQDRADGRQLSCTRTAESGENKIFMFKAANGHTYDVVIDSDVYKASEQAALVVDELRSVSPSITVTLAFKPVNYTVSFDPGAGAFPSDAGVELVDGRAQFLLANGSYATVPSDPVRDGYVFAGWFDGARRFLTCVPVTGNASYVAAWVEKGQQPAHTFLLDAGSASRDGSYAKPYRVTTEQDLRDFASIVNGADPVDGAWRDANGRAPASLAGKYVSLEADLALTEAAVPVGIGSAATGGAYKARPFSGTFLGNNHVIDSFAVTAQSNPAFGGDTLANGPLVTQHYANSYSALFGAVAGATIQDVTVKLAGGALSANAAAAGLVALASNGTTRIGHCAVQGDISATDQENGERVAGGLVAVYAPSSGSSLKIDHCYQVGSVQSPTLAGGLVGSIAAAGTSVIASYHVGSVTSGSSSATQSVGAFIGGASGDGATCTVTDCVTEQALEPVGETARERADVTSCKTGLAVSAWASGSDEGGARELLGDEYFDFAKALPCGSPDLSDARWVSGYQVSFTADDNGVTGDVPSMAPQDEGAVFTLPSCTLKRVGYELAGWKRTDAADEKVYATGATFTMPAEDVTFAAQWTAVRKTALTDALARALSARKGVAHVAERASDVAAGESFVTAAEMASLDEAIAAAQAVRANMNVSQSVVAIAAENLLEALATFEAAVKYGTKSTETSQQQSNSAPKPEQAASTPNPSATSASAGTGTNATGKTNAGKTTSTSTAAPTPAKKAQSAAEKPLAKGTVVKSVAAGKGVTYNVKVTGAKTVTLKKATVKSGATVSVNKVKIKGVTYKVTAIAASAFKGTKAKKVTIGANVKTIGASAFANAKKLTTVTVGKNVKTIGKNAFKGDAKLKTVTLGKNVKTIKANAFKACKALKKITVKSSKLTKASFKNLLKGSKIKTVKLKGVSKKAKKNYKKWAKLYGATVK